MLLLLFICSKIKNNYYSEKEEMIVKEAANVGHGMEK